MLGLLRVEEGVMMTSELQQSAAQRPVNTQSVHLCIDTIYTQYWMTETLCELPQIHWRQHPESSCCSPLRAPWSAPTHSVRWQSPAAARISSVNNSTASVFHTQWKEETAEEHHVCYVSQDTLQTAQIQHVEGPGAAFKEKRQRDVLYGQVEGTKSSAEHSCLSTDRKHSRKQRTSWITHFLSVTMRLQPNTERCFCPEESREETRVFTDIRSSERWNMRLESSSASRRAAVKPWVLMTDSDGTNTSWFKHEDKHGAPDPPAWEQADMSAVSESVSLSQWQEHSCCSQSLNWPEVSC